MRLLKTFRLRLQIIKTMEKEEDAKKPIKFSWHGIKSPEQLTEEKAWQLFGSARWDGEKKCLYCGHVGIVRSKHRRLLLCPICKRKFTIRNGTPYHKARVPMDKIILFIILAHGGIPVNRIYKVLGISKTAALRLSAITKTCSIAKKILEFMQKNESLLTVEKIIYYCNPDIDSTFKYKKKYQLAIQDSNKKLPRCRICGTYDIEDSEINCRNCRVK